MINKRKTEDIYNPRGSLINIESEILKLDEYESLRRKTNMDLGIINVET